MYDPDHSPRADLSYQTGSAGSPPFGPGAGGGGGSGGSGGSGGRRAVIFVAVVALIEVLLFGCCTAGVFVTEPSITELRDSPFGVPEGVTEEQMLTMVRGIQIALAIASALVFVLPGLALLIMTPWIDRGRRGAINAARIILWVQAVLIGLALLTNVIISLLTLNLLSLLVSLVFLGSLLALQVLAIRALSQSRPSSAAPFDDDHDLEPWNSHLT